MKIFPSRTNAESYEIHDVSFIELQNLLRGLKGERHFLENSPWGKSTIKQFEDALEAMREFYYNTSW